MTTHKRPQVLHVFQISDLLLHPLCKESRVLNPPRAKETSPRTKEQGTETPSSTAAAVPRPQHLQAEHRTNTCSPPSFLALPEHTQREIHKDCMEYVAVKVDSAHQ